ncbi:MAG: hypothetical protein JO064_05560 [Actinobacteria bacterium]|nr:hypothetical protein [Actinomycetota bacterium]
MDSSGARTVLTRRALVWSALAGALELALPARVRASLFSGALVSEVSVANGARPFAGDGPLLTTVSPGGARGRDRAVVAFKLARPATVQLDVVDHNALVTDLRGVENPALTVATERQALPAGAHELAWVPAAGLAPASYMLMLTVTDAHGTHPLGRVGVARVLGLDAAFAKRSYAPGDTATLVVAADATELTVQVFRSGGETVPTYSNDLLNGVAVGEPGPVPWAANVDHPAPITVSVGPDWPSGVYYVQLTAGDLVGYAPFVVRPASPQQRVAVVVPTNTWGAYNFYDRNGDGYGDSWYVGWRTHTVDLTRPNLHRGVPYKYRSYDLAFLRWLAQTGKTVDFYADDDLGSFATGDDLRAAYDLVVFPGHSEYVTSQAYTVVERYRDLGGDLMFLSANNFFRRVDPHGDTLQLIDLWRNLGRPEAGLCGVQYCGSDRGQHQAPFVVTADGAASWAFAGTGLSEGSSFGRYGIEVDARAAATPDGAVVLAQIPNALGNPNLTAEMTYYETDAGARVFSAGALNFGGQLLLWPETTQLVANVWSRLTEKA